jgi:hypothetical protein
VPTGVNFSVPATNGTAGHATTQTSLFLYIPSAPAGNTTILDYDLSSGDYFRLRLATTRHLWLEFQKSGYGSATVDLGAVSVATWTWITCGFKTSGGLYIRGDVTPVGGATSTATALASSGSATGVTLTGVPFGVGVTLTSAYADFPNNVAGGWLCSKLIQTQIASNAASGNPEPMPVTDYTSSYSYREYLGHDALGTQATLSDSGTAAIDLIAGTGGLTIVDDGPALLPSSPGPANGHKGDLVYYHLNTWQTLHVGTAGQALTVVTGEPAWGTIPQTTVQSESTEAATNDTLTGGTSLLNQLNRIRYQLAQLGTGAWNTLRAMVQLSPSSQQTGTINVSGEIQGSDLKAGGLTGATQASRYVGATTSGAPASGTFAKGDFVLDQTGKFWVCTTAGTPGTWTQVAGSGGSVTSVALTMPAEFTVSGSPITGAGTLAVTKANESANQVFAGPTSGGAAAPTFRSMVSSDLPSAPTVSGEVTGSDFKATGLTGATAASRYVGGTASGAPSSGTFAVGDHAIDQTGTIYVCTVAGSPGTWVQIKANPTFSGEVTASDFKPTGLTGATAASRYVGATASGAPASGTFAVGDFVIDQTGKAWICTVAGTPGTWTQLAGGSSTLAADTDVSLSSPTGGQVLGYSSALSKWVNQNQAGVAATQTSAQLGADVTMTSANTFYDGPTITVSPGTWLLVGEITGYTTVNSITQWTAKLWDGTNVVSSVQATQENDSSVINLPLSALVTITTTTTYKISAANSSAGATIKAATLNNSAGNNASRLNAIQLSGNPVGQQAPAVRCYNSANISIPNTTTTVLTFDSNRFDQGTSVSQHSTSSNTSRLVCQQAGVYQITGHVYWASAASGHAMQTFIRLNGSTAIEYTSFDTPASSQDGQLVSTLYYLNVGDYVELCCWHNVGSAVNVEAHGNYSPEFGMARIDSGPGAVQPNTKVQLDYAASTDIFTGGAASSGAWVDLISNQTFMVDDANSVVEFSLSGMCIGRDTGQATTIGVRLNIDSGATTKMVAGNFTNSANTYANIFAGANTVEVTGLSAGSHTVKSQVYFNGGSAAQLYCKIASEPNSYSLNLRVLERKQSSSPPSSTPAPAVRCYNSANISIPNAAWTSLTFNTNRLDQGTSTSQHSTSSNTSRLTCQQAGMYVVTGHIEFAANASGDLRAAAIVLNGTTFLGIMQLPGVASGSDATRLTITTTYYLNIGDYVELSVEQNSGGALNVLTDGNFSPEFMMARIDSGGQGFVPIPMVKTANYTILNSDAMVVAGANSLTFTLPAVSTRAPGMPLVVKNDNFTATTISRAGSDTIDGATSYSLVAAYASVTLVGDGLATWRII